MTCFDLSALIENGSSLIWRREEGYGQSASADMQPATSAVYPYGCANHLIAMTPDALDFSGMAQINSPLISFDQIGAVLRNLLKFIGDPPDPKRIYAVYLFQMISNDAHKLGHRSIPTQGRLS